MKERRTILFQEFFTCNEETNIITFKEAGDELVDFIDKGEKYSWYDAFLRPIIFLYRHYLEIELKFWINDLFKLNHEQPIVLKGHDLKLFWDKLEPLIFPFCKSQEEQKMLNEVKNVISLFHEYDPTSQESRYIRTIKGDYTLSKLPPKIDVKLIKKLIATVYYFFDGLSGVIYS